jgi:hypothetical protein
MNKEQPPRNPEPLPYWHSTETPPVHGVILALALLGGLVAAAILMAVIGALFIALTVSTQSHQTGDVWFALPAGIVLFGFAILSFVLLVKHFARKRFLPFALWRMPTRFFTLGFLIGCGVIALLEGICFTGISISGLNL